MFVIFRCSLTNVEPTDRILLQGAKKAFNLVKFSLAFYALQHFTVNQSTQQNEFVV